jgi:hypothetical protein
MMELKYAVTSLLGKSASPVNPITFKNESTIRKPAATGTIVLMPLGVSNFDHRKPD